MAIFFPLLIAIIGLLIYALAKDSKVVEVGHVMFWTGLLAFLLSSSGWMVNVLRR